MHITVDPTDETADAVTSQRTSKHVMKRNYMKPRLEFIFAIVFSASSAVPATLLAQTRLSQWDRGVSVDSTDQADMRVYLWF